MISKLRSMADALIEAAEELPRRSRAAELLRDAAASVLDADLELRKSRSAPPENFVSVGEALARALAGISALGPVCEETREKAV